MPHSRSLVSLLVVPGLSPGSFDVFVKLGGTSRGSKPLQHCAAAAQSLPMLVWCMPADAAPMIAPAGLHVIGSPARLLLAAPKPPKEEPSAAPASEEPTRKPPNKDEPSVAPHQKGATEKGAAGALPTVPAASAGAAVQGSAVVAAAATAVQEAVKSSAGPAPDGEAAVREGAVEANARRGSRVSRESRGD